MALADATSIPGGYGTEITDWQLGDDRIFSGIAPGLPAGIPVLDNSCTDAYFTLKSSPNSIDADAILQKHITQTPSAAGAITIGSVAAFNNLLINVHSADYEGLVSVGPLYYWDVRVITTNGRTYTVATGTVAFAQNVTQTNAAGTPATLPNNGMPRFRGFLPMHPKLIPGFNGTFNQGDYFRNALATSGAASGWVAINACSDATGFRTDGIIGND